MMWAWYVKDRINEDKHQTLFFDETNMSETSVSFLPLQVFKKIKQNNSKKVLSLKQ